MIYCAKIIIIFKSFHFFGKNIPDRYKKHLISPCFNCLLAVNSLSAAFAMPHGRRSSSEYALLP